jgi:hypothetical protein
LSGETVILFPCFKILDKKEAVTKKRDSLLASFLPDS